MTRSIDLFQLQESDAAIDAAERRLLEIDADLGGETDLAALEAHVVELEQQLAQARSEQRVADDAVEDQRAATKQLEEKLYSGAVKIPRELKSLQEDVQAHQRQLAALEERSLTTLARLEQDQAALAAGREEHELRLEERRRQVASLEAEREQIKQSLEGLRAERARRAARIDAPDLALYERLRRARGGRAVAKVERGTCQGCRITLPTTIFQRARSGLKIVQCTSCERILYVV